MLVPLIYDPKAGQLIGTRMKTAGSQVSVMPFLRQNTTVLAGLVLLSAGTSAMGFGSISAWSPEILQRIYEMEPAQAGAAIGGVMLGAAVFAQAIYSVTTDWFAKRGFLDAPIRVGLAADRGVVALSHYFAYRAAGRRLLPGMAIRTCYVALSRAAGSPTPASSR